MNQPCVTLVLTLWSLGQEEIIFPHSRVSSIFCTRSREMSSIWIIGKQAFQCNIDLWPTLICAVHGWIILTSTNFLHGLLLQSSQAPQSWAAQCPAIPNDYCCILWAPQMSPESPWGKGMLISFPQINHSPCNGADQVSAGYLASADWSSPTLGCPDQSGA